MATSGVARITASLLRRARLDAERTRAEANAAAEAVCERARADAAQILADARAAGRTAAADSAGVRMVQARRRARAVVLAARREAHEELHRRTRVAVAALCEDPDVVDRLRRLAQARAGPSARILDAPGGGVVALAPDRRVDCSAYSLADHAVEVLGTEVERLWEC